MYIFRTLKITKLAYLNEEMSDETGVTPNLNNSASYFSELRYINQYNQSQTMYTASYIS